MCDTADSNVTGKVAKCVIVCDDQAWNYAYLPEFN